MGKRDFRGIEDFSPADIGEVFSLARQLKDEVKKGVFRPLLAGRGLAMIFEKPSLRTRSTFDLGIFQLGGHAIHLRPEEVGVGTRESVPDVARNLERWFDLVVARTFAQATVDDLAAYCSKPVINALSDQEHPCQAMADFFTMIERIGPLETVRLGYVGDGNNMTHSLLMLGALTGAEVRAAAPNGYAPKPELVARARSRHPKGEKGIWIGEDPAQCLEGCNAVYTDVWASMGQEKEAEERARIFAPYQLNERLLSRALPGAKVMHCLPAHRGLEITDDVIDGPASIVYDQAENRLHVQKAIMAYLHRASGGTLQGLDD